MEAECIELYKSIEKNHPLPKVKRQAASLRYIMEAPKLKLGEDERVKLPILEATRYKSAPTHSPHPPPAKRKYNYSRALIDQKFLTRSTYLIKSMLAFMSSYLLGNP
jgi:hypothetical protein